MFPTRQASPSSERLDSSVHMQETSSRDGKFVQELSSGPVATCHQVPSSSIGAPKKPLSAYNIFFQLERENILKGQEDQNYTQEHIARIASMHQARRRLRPKRKHRKTHGIISFKELARLLANKWKNLDAGVKELFEQRAAIEKAVYKCERSSILANESSPCSDAAKPIAETVNSHMSPTGTVYEQPHFERAVSQDSFNECTEYRNDTLSECACFVGVQDHLSIKNFAHGQSFSQSNCQLHQMTGKSCIDCYQPLQISSSSLSDSVVQQEQQENHESCSSKHISKLNAFYPLLEIITAAHEGPETPEEAEEMHRLLKSYEYEI